VAATGRRRWFDSWLGPVLDPLLAPVSALSARQLKLVRRIGLLGLPRTAAALRRVGIFPVRDHYYEPLIDPKHLRHPLDVPRDLPGIDLRIDAQLALLARLRYADELHAIPVEGGGPGRFAWDNGTYFFTDAQFLYGMIRLHRPRRIYEVGSGNSTLVARLAIAANQGDDPSYTCEHVCIEPYEMPWLEGAGVRVLRQRVEELDPSFFAALAADDLLFVDSSHMIRPQGDVLFEIQRVLPRLAPGVLVHVHDVFTPRDYPAEWIDRRQLFWNEQYLLEAFLACNPRYEVVAALHHLSVEHPTALAEACPVRKPGRPSHPSGFWIRSV
jgi:hypothetical protein